MSYKDFKSTNEFVEGLKETQQKFVVWDSVVSFFSRMLSIIQGVAQSYARSYALVQQIQYDEDGNITDVTSEERQSVANSVISYAKEQLGQLELEIETSPTPIGDIPTEVQVEGAASSVDVLSCSLVTKTSSTDTAIRGVAVFDFIKRSIVVSARPEGKPTSSTAMAILLEPQSFGVVRISGYKSKEVEFTNLDYSPYVGPNYDVALITRYDASHFYVMRKNHATGKMEGWRFPVTSIAGVNATTVSVDAEWYESDNVMGNAMPFHASVVAETPSWFNNIPSIHLSDRAVVTLQHTFTAQDVYRALCDSIPVAEAMASLPD